MEGLRKKDGRVSTSQADVDSLLAQAESLRAETEGEAVASVEAASESAPPPPAPDAEPPPPPNPPAPAPSCAAAPTDKLSHLLRIEVPVIVKLAECQMPFHRVISLNTGSIIEFDKPADAMLDLMINNRTIGVGQAVKVGENFGLRIMHIGTLQEKIRAMGG